jgi:rSAM/selenodomain-associated transferase 2
MTADLSLVSIILPIYNEASAIGAALDALNLVRGHKEILVVDGGSSDGTGEIAVDRGVSVINACRGRARQMNAGAQAAKGSILLFLHCDSRLSPEALEQMHTALDTTKSIGGCFQLAMDDPSPIFKLICFMSNLRARWCKLYFGDQAIFTRRDSFIAVGGFSDLEMMEDWELSRKLARQGKLVQVSATVTTSARRFQRQGIWSTIWLMQKLKIMYLCGVPTEVLKRSYDDVR